MATEEGLVERAVNTDFFFLVEKPQATPGSSESGKLFITEDVKERSIKGLSLLHIKKVHKCSTSVKVNVSTVHLLWSSEHE